MRDVYDNALLLKKPENMMDMINLTANLDSICVINNIYCERDLGKFVIDEELFEINFPGYVRLYLDYGEIGYEYLNSHNGIIENGIYVEDTLTPAETVEIYDGVNIPNLYDEPEETNDITM